MPPLKRCPCCGRDITNFRTGVSLGPKQARIFDLIAKHPGITNEALAERVQGVSGPLAQASIRALITAMRVKLRPRGITIQGRHSLGYTMKGHK